MPPLGAVQDTDQRMNAAFEPDAGPDSLKAAKELKAKLAGLAGVRPPVAPDRPVR